MSKGLPAKSAKRFSKPQAFLSDLDARTVAELLGAASDLVLLLDEKGVVRDAALGQSGLPEALVTAWVGQAWRDTVTVESQPKVDDLLRLALDGQTDAKPRQINHPQSGETDLPLDCVIVPLPARGNRKGRPAVVFCRDLRGPAAVQQRLVSAQASMERDYWQLRQVENRHRLLFQTASDALLILDADSLKLQDANTAAHQLFGEALQRSSWRLADGVEAASRTALQALLAQLQATGKSEARRVRLVGRSKPVDLQGHLIRQGASGQLVLRVLFNGAGAPTEDPRRERLAQLAELSPDAFVVTGPDGLVQAANRAFLDLVQLPTEERVTGQSLERWFERGGLDLNVLMSNLRQRGEVRLYATRLRTEYGAGIDVEISAAAAGGELPAMGFAIRDIGRRLAAEPVAGGRELPRSADQMTELVGRVPLREIVRETTDLIEQLCIEAALALTNDNRASAAEMLGLSRQSLYVKLRRFGLADGGE
ncbi:transcriptional regulator PpsR [Hydrogenophaga sp. T2]|uniref:transcriptional regulator PpsR n=1 Tax=Hydrogenophaga sp. T2 TaxID=3132823 RepID=UPI003CF55AD1